MNNELPELEQKEDSIADTYLDTICVVNGKVFFFSTGEMVDPSIISDDGRVWVSDPALQVVPSLNASPSLFYVSIPYKTLLVDFGDENSLAQMPMLMKRHPGFERYSQNSNIEEGIHAYYEFEVDFPTDTVKHAESIRNWLAEKIAESNTNAVDIPYLTSIYINYRKGPDGMVVYTGDIKDNQQIAQFAASVYFANVKAEFADEDEAFLPIGLSRSLNMLAKCCNDRFVTYQQCTFDYSGGTHGYFTESLLSFDHVNNLEIDFSYLFKPGCEKDLLELLVEEAKKSPGYKEWEPDVVAGVADRDEENNLIGTYTFPRPGLTEDGVVFSFQPYEISCYAAGAFHFVIPYEKLEHLITDRAKWCMDIK